MKASFILIGLVVTLIVNVAQGKTVSRRSVQGESQQDPSPSESTKEPSVDRDEKSDSELEIHLASSNSESGNDTEQSKANKSDSDGKSRSESDPSAKKSETKATSRPEPSNNSTTNGEQKPTTQDDKSKPRQDDKSQKQKDRGKTGSESKSPITLPPSLMASVGESDAKNKTIVLTLKDSSISNFGRKGASLVLGSNGTNLIASGGTMKPVTNSTAQAIAEKAKNNPSAYKVEKYHSIEEFKEIIDDLNRTLVEKTTSSETVELTRDEDSTTEADLLKTTTTTTTRPTTIRPTVLGSTTKKSPKRTTTTKRATTTRLSTSRRTTYRSSTSRKPITKSPPKSTKTPVKSTKKPFVTSMRPSKLPCKPTVPIDFKDTDKLLAVVITDKGSFKGRRINQKAIDTILRASLNQTRIDSSKGITVTSNNSFVFPAGNYYFPRPVRFVGFVSP